jgi:enoyl-CoA hydratase/carnithine racemase
MADIKVEKEGYVATLTLNRPQAMNTISQPMLVSLAEHLIACDDDPDIRAIIITGEGRAFCAGLDLKDAASEEGVSRGGFALAATLNLKTFPPNVLFHMDTPTICALNGGAAGFGMDLALACDIRVAAASAKLAAVFTKRGVVPESGGTWLLPRLLGWSRACDIVFRGKTLDDRTCLELGLVNELVEDDQLVEAARLIANEIAACAPLAVQASKRMMRAALSEGFDQHTERAYLQTLPLLQSKDFREGFSAYLEKREAHFTGE